MRKTDQAEGARSNEGDPHVRPLPRGESLKRWSGSKGSWKPPAREPSKTHPAVLDLTLPACSGMVVVRVNGKTLVETSALFSSTTDQLMQEVASARAAMVACRFLHQALEHFQGAKPDHVNQTPKKAREAFAKGLDEGLRGVTVPHPTEPTLPPVPSTYDPSFMRGYELGTALARAVAFGSGDLVVVPDVNHESP